MLYHYAQFEKSMKHLNAACELLYADKSREGGIFGPISCSGIGWSKRGAYRLYRAKLTLPANLEPFEHSKIVVLY